MPLFKKKKKPEVPKKKQRSSSVPDLEVDMISAMGNQASMEQELERDVSSVKPGRSRKNSFSESNGSAPPENLALQGSNVISNQENPALPKINNAEEIGESNADSLPVQKNSTFLIAPEPKGEADGMAKSVKKSYREQLEALEGSAPVQAPKKKSFFGKIGGFFGKVGKKLTAPLSAIRKAHQKAVDAFNNYEADYKTMSRWDRFWWTVKNPIARLRGGQKSSSMNETIARNAVRAHLNSIADQARDVLREDDTEDSLESFLGVQTQDEWENARGNMVNQQVPPVPGTGEEAPVGFKDRLSAATGKLALPLTEGNLALTYAPKLKDLPAPSPLVAKGMGAGAGAMSFVNSAMSAHNARKSGDNTTAVSEGFNAAGSASWALGGAADLLGDTALPAIKDSIPLDKVLPGMDIFTGAATMASGITKYKGASSTKKNIGKIIENLRDPGKNLPEAEQAKYERTLKQIQAFTGVDKVRGVTGMVSGANRIVGNALGFGPAAVLGPLIANVGSTAIDLAGDAIANKVASGTAKKVVNQDLDVEAKIKAVQQWKGLNREQAKYVVFKAMGSTTGTREEAFQRMTMKRALFLKNQADAASGNDTNNVALQTMKAMNLSKNQDGEYDLQTITQKLGMGTDPWQEQLRKTLKKQNPFRSFKRERM